MLVADRVVASRIYDLGGVTSGRGTGSGITNDTLSSISTTSTSGSNSAKFILEASIINSDSRACSSNLGVIDITLSNNQITSIGAIGISLTGTSISAHIVNIIPCTSSITCTLDTTSTSNTLGLAGIGCSAVSCIASVVVDLTGISIEGTSLFSSISSEVTAIITFTSSVGGQTSTGSFSVSIRSTSSGFSGSECTSGVVSSTISLSNFRTSGSGTSGGFGGTFSSSVSTRSLGGASILIGGEIRTLGSTFSVVGFGGEGTKLWVTSGACFEICTSDIGSDSGTAEDGN